MENTSAEMPLSRKRQHSRSRSKSPSAKNDEQDLKRKKLNIEETINIKQNEISKNTIQEEITEINVSGELKTNEDGDKNVHKDECDSNHKKDVQNVILDTPIDTAVEVDNDKDLQQNIVDEIENKKTGNSQVNSVEVEEGIIKTMIEEDISKKESDVQVISTTEETNSEPLNKSDTAKATEKSDDIVQKDNTEKSEVVLSNGEEQLVAKDEKSEINDSSTPAKKLKKDVSEELTVELKNKLCEGETSSEMDELADEKSISIPSSDSDEVVDKENPVANGSNLSPDSKASPEVCQKEIKVDSDQKANKEKDSEVLSSGNDEPIDKEKSDSLSDSNIPTKKLKVVTPNKKLTPKQLQKKLEMEKRQQEKQKEREDRLKKKLEEKQKRKEEREKEFEQKRKEKEEKEDKKRKEREEKEQKRKEKEEKEEQKRKEREEEKLKKLQEIEEKNKEKLKVEEKKQKAAAAFVNFFVAKKTDESQDEKKTQEEKKIQTSNFLQFEIKSDMKLPLPRREMLSKEQKEKLDQYLENQDKDVSYLKELSSGKPFGKSLKTWPYEESLDDDVVIVDLGETFFEDNSRLQKYKAKFLYFHENRRPAYYGTWRKKSKIIQPKKPLAEDRNLLNYDEDSDDDWEEEEQGESLNGSEDEVEKENEDDKDDYEVDNEFFVPHGHLSDDEVDDEELSRLSPDSLKQKLKLLKEEFDQDMKSKTHKLKPRSIGCIWYNKDGSNVKEAVDRYLQPLSIIHQDQIIIKKRVDIFVIKDKKKVARELDPDHIPIFLKVVNHSTCRKSILIERFLAELGKIGANQNISKGMIIRELRRSATWEKYRDTEANRYRFRWLVHQDLREKYDLDIKMDIN